MPEPGPNLLFIMTDHQRADSLDAVQAGAEVTPRLNTLAQRSAVFTRAYTTCPLCTPARTALATGLYPTRNGIVFNDWKGRRAGDHLTLHEVLARVGYRVGHVGVHHVRVKPDLRERVPFTKWIDEGDFASYFEAHDVDYFAPTGRAAFSRGVTELQENKHVEVSYSNTRTATWPHPIEHFRDSYYCREALEFLNAQHDEPFALFVNLWAPHPPLVVPEPYASCFDPEKIDLPGNVGIPADGEPPGRRLGIAAQLAEGVSLEEWRSVWVAHLGLVHLADELIGRMLDALESTACAPNTVVVFTCDHGDHLGQHAMYQKMEMYEQAIRVPLVVHVPGAPPGCFDTPVSHLDLVPTLLEVLGLPARDGLDGISLADSLTRGTPLPERTVFAQYSGNPTLGDCRRAAVTHRWKYVHDPKDEPELYDLDADPLEMTNLAPLGDHDSVVRELHDECRAWHAAHGDRVAFD